MPFLILNRAKGERSFVMVIQSLATSRSGLILKLVTAVWLGLLIGVSIWDGVSIESTLPIKLVLWILTLCGGVLLLSTILLGVLWRNRRRLYFTLTCLVIVGFGFSWFSAYWHMRTRQNWFVRNGVGVYEDLLSKILANRTLLTDKPRSLHNLVQHPSSVVGRTNHDGSVTIWFGGRDGSARRGYLYHSGSRLTADPSDSRSRLMHLTNGWYEY